MQDQLDRPSSLAMAFKPFRDMFVFSGRSRRTEVLAFAILGTFANVVAVELVDGGMMQKVIGAGWGLVWGFPWIALLVRRLHDQGRPALWAWLMAAVLTAFMAITPLLPQSGAGNYHVTMFGWIFHPVGPWAIVHGIVTAVGGLAMFAICFAPEQPGTNKYGPDPRLDPQPDTLELG